MDPLAEFVDNTLIYGDGSYYAGYNAATEYIRGNGDLLSRGDFRTTSSIPRVMTREYYHQDILGSTMMVSNRSGYSVNSYSYDAFGNAYSGDFRTDNQTGYTGKEYDPVSGLYNYGFRDYNTMLARFTTVDPIRDGQNWYVYCGNDPVNYTDPTGLAPRNLTSAQRAAYMQVVQNITPADIPDSHDCADVGLYIYNKAMESATGQTNAYTNVYKNGSQLTSLRNIQAANTFGQQNINNEIINYYDANGNGQTYDSSQADTAFNSDNVEVGTVGIYKPTPGSTGFTGHTITVTGVTRDANGNVTAIEYIEGHMSGQNQEVHTFTQEGGAYGDSSLHNRYSDTIFVGWGEYEPQCQN